MTYDNPELVQTVLEGELKRQQGAAEWAQTRIDALDTEIAPFIEQRAELLLVLNAAQALVDGLQKTLAKVQQGDPEPEAEGEDPYEAAFETTAEPEPAKDQTFDHRAPMFVNTAPDRGEPVGWDNPL